MVEVGNKLLNGDLKTMASIPFGVKRELSGELSM
jgi:hypothetical protein